MEGSCRDADYGERLTALLQAYDRPVLFPTGADTLRWISAHREELAGTADFLVASPRRWRISTTKRRCTNGAWPWACLCPRSTTARQTVTPWW